MSTRLDIMSRLKEAGLRATPQRLAIFETLRQMRNHPTADQLLKVVQDAHPEISLATIYNTLEIFLRKGLIRKVKSDRDSMRYDAEVMPHHHLYCYESDKIGDYFDEELTEMISEYFKDHQIKGFEISDVKVQVIGKFKTGTPKPKNDGKKEKTDNSIS